MKNEDLALRLARKARISSAAAADRLDGIIHDILAELKQGRSVNLPGLGTFKPGRKLGFEFDRKTAGKSVPHDKKR